MGCVRMGAGRLRLESGGEDLPLVPHPHLHPSLPGTMGHGESL